MLCGKNIQQMTNTYMEDNTEDHKICNEVKFRYRIIDKTFHK